MSIPPLNLQTNHNFKLNPMILNSIFPQTRNKVKIQQNLNNYSNLTYQQRLKHLYQKRQINSAVKQQKFRSTKSNQKDYNIKRFNDKDFQNPYKKKIFRRESLRENINSIEKSAQLLQKKSNSQPAKKFENNFRFRVYTNAYHKKSDPRMRQILQKQSKQLFLNNKQKSDTIGQVYQKIFYPKVISMKPTNSNQKVQEEDQISKRYIQNQIFTFQNQSLEFGYDEQIDKIQKYMNNHEQIKKSQATKNFRRKKFEKSTQLVTLQLNRDDLKYIESSNIDNKVSNIYIDQQQQVV